MTLYIIKIVHMPGFRKGLLFLADVLTWGRLTARIKFPMQCFTYTLAHVFLKILKITNSTCVLKLFHYLLSV